MSEPVGDFLRPVNPGQSLQIPAATWNLILDVVREARRGLRSLGGAGLGQLPETPAQVLVKNTTGAAVGQFGILGTTAPVILPTDNAEAFRDRRLLTGAAPTATDPFVITQEAINADTIGRAVCLGLTPVQVNVSDAGHGYAVPSTSTSELSSAAIGPVRLLWKESGTGSGKWALGLITGLPDVCTLLRSLTSYNGSAVQILGHDASGACQWYDVGTCESE